MFIFKRPISAVLAGLVTTLIGVLLAQGFTVASTVQQGAAAW
jgi:molybdopterin-binding protein